jgi:CRISPR-associated protein Cmr6
MNDNKLKFQYYLHKNNYPSNREIMFQENEYLNMFSLVITYGSYLLILKGKQKTAEFKTGKNETGEKDEKNEEDYEESKRKFMEFMVKNGSNYFKQKKEEIKQYLNELKMNLQNYLGNRGYIRGIEMRLTYRGSFGVSSIFGQIPFEVGLYIHPYFNVPYIPASSIKGAIRNAYYSLLVQENENMDEEEIKKECDYVFGDSNFAGLVGFTDALPIQEGENGYILYPDIINPHYKDAVDEMSVQPTPIIFLTVAPGTTFKFFMYVIKERVNGKEKRRIESKHLINKPLPDLNKLGLLDKALLYGLAIGIGAKTALGYSQFMVIKYE